MSGPDGTLRRVDLDPDPTAQFRRWYGEAEGLKVSLAGAKAKLAQMDQISANRTRAVQLGIPSFTDTAGRSTEPADERNQQSHNRTRTQQSRSI